MLPAALQTGRLAAGGGCIWMDTGPTDRMALIWPPGYTARGEPVNILDATGAIVATVGDTIEVSGGAIPHGPVCGILTVWVVGSVTRQ